jgi:hypothetical protein
MLIGSYFKTNDNSGFSKLIKVINKKPLIKDNNSSIYYLF